MTTMAQPAHRPATPSGEPVTEPITVPAGSRRSPGLRETLLGIAADVGLPVGTYYAFHALGATDTAALVAGAVAAAARIGLTALRTRRVTGFAVLMLAVYAVGVGMSFVSGDPHLMLVKDSVGTAVVGVGFLVSLAIGRPMLLDTMRTFHGSGEDIVARYATEPAVRRTVHLLTAMWGVGLVADAVVRVPLVYLMPISVGVGVSHVLSLVMIALLAVASGLVVRHARRADVTRER